MWEFSRNLHIFSGAKETKIYRAFTFAFESDLNGQFIWNGGNFMGNIRVNTQWTERFHRFTLSWMQRACYRNNQMITIANVWLQISAISLTTTGNIDTKLSFLTIHLNAVLSIIPQIHWKSNVNQTKWIEWIDLIGFNPNTILNWK